MITTLGEKHQLAKYNGAKEFHMDGAKEFHMLAHVVNCLISI